MRCTTVDHGASGRAAVTLAGTTGTGAPRPSPLLLSRMEMLHTFTLPTAAYRSTLNGPVQINVHYSHVCLQISLQHHVIGMLAIQSGLELQWGMSCVILDREAASCGGQYKLFAAAAVHSLTQSFINIPPPGRSIGPQPQLPGAELMIVTWAVGAVLLCCIMCCVVLCCVCCIVLCCNVLCCI